MKIRYDYVSNSSTSSFFIIGKTYERDEIYDLIRKYHQDFTDEEIEYFYDFDFEKWLEKDFDLSYHRGFEESYYACAIGLFFDDMKDDETKAQFIKRVSDNLAKLFGEPQDVEAFNDDGYC